MGFSHDEILEDFEEVADVGRRYWLDNEGCAGAGLSARHFLLPLLPMPTAEEFEAAGKALREHAELIAKERKRKRQAPTESRRAYWRLYKHKHLARDRDKHREWKKKSRRRHDAQLKMTRAARPKYIIELDTTPWIPGALAKAKHG